MKWKISKLHIFLAILIILMNLADTITTEIALQKKDLYESNWFMDLLFKLNHGFAHLYKLIIGILLIVLSLLLYNSKLPFSKYVSYFLLFYLIYIFAKTASCNILLTMSKTVNVCKWKYF